MKTHLNIIMPAVFAVLLSACQKPGKPSDDLARVPAHQEQEVTVTDLEPDGMLQQAIESFAKEEYDESSAYIREAAHALNEIAPYASKRHMEAIEHSARDLETLADHVEKQQVKDISTLYHYFGNVGRALAQYRLNVSQDEFFNHSEAQAGTTLKRAVDQLERSVITHHRSLTPEEKIVLQDVRKVALRLQNGEKVPEEELTLSYQKIDNEIVKWDKEFGNLTLTAK